MEANQQTEEKKNRHIILWVIIAVLLLTFIGFVAYIYHDKSQQQSQEDAEKAAWLKVQKWEGLMQLDSLEAAISQYQDVFIHGVHAEQVEAIRQKIETERTAWLQALNAATVEEMEDFVRNHSDSYYRNQANRKIDSLSYLEANDEDTYAAYERYLDSFGDGIYATEAQKRMDDLDGGTISDKETASVQQMLDKHFKALATNDKQMLDETIAPMLSTYIGQNDASRADVNQYMKRMHSDSERTLNFMLQNTTVAKEVNDHKPTYSITFTLTEEATKGSQTNTLNFIGKAQLNDELQITSLSLNAK